MAIQLMLAATTRRYVAGYDPSRGHVMEIRAGITVGEVAGSLGIPREEIKLILVDGRHAEWDSVLQGDERVALFPPVGGG